MRQRVISRAALQRASEQARAQALRRAVASGASAGARRSSPLSLGPWTAPQAHEAGERFNPGWLEDDAERVLLEQVGSCVTPLCAQPGRVVLTQARIYFQPFNVVSNAPIQTYQLDKVGGRVGGWGHPAGEGTGRGGQSGGRAWQTSVGSGGMLVALMTQGGEPGCWVSGQGPSLHGLL